MSFRDHSVLQSLSTDCRVLRSCSLEVPVLLSHSAPPSIPQSTKLRQSLCIDCGGSWFRGAAPTKQVWQAKIRLHEPLFSCCFFFTPTAIFMNRLLIYFIQVHLVSHTKKRSLGVRKLSCVSSCYINTIGNQIISQINAFRTQITIH